MPKPIPDAYRGATPYIIVNDAAKAIEFYQRAFGATEYVRLADSTGKVMHAELRIGSAQIMLADEFPEMGYRSPQSLGGSAVSMLFFVEDVDALVAQATAAGAVVKDAVADQFDGDRRGTLIDPYGHVWLVASRKEDISAEELRRRFEAMLKQGEPT